MVGLREAVRELPDPVAADLLENEEAYLLVIDLPGATPGDTDIATTDGTLAVRADRAGDPSAGADPVREERPATLDLDLPLPDDADAEAARASLADGVLEVTIPRGSAGISIPIEER